MKGLTELRTLDLAYCRQITDAGLTHLEGLKKLETLSLASTQITDAALPHLKGLKNLETLSLADTQITDAGLAHLKEFTKLRTLGLSGCKNLTKEDVADLQKALPNTLIW